MVGGYLTVHVVAGDVRPGAWCDRCLLPSGLTCRLYGLYQHGVDDLGLLWVCSRCGRIEQQRRTWAGPRSPRGELDIED